MGSKKLPQNINNLLMEIGEKSIIFQLYVRTRNSGWNVYYNLCEVGCDIVLLNPASGKQIKIEAKTRQRLYTTSTKAHFNFQVTQNEYNNIDFLIAYWFDQNAYFIVPKERLRKTTSNGNNIYYIKAGLKKDGSFGFDLENFKDNWKAILNKLS